MTCPGAQAPPLDPDWFGLIRYGFMSSCFFLSTRCPTTGKPELLVGGLDWCFGDLTHFDPLALEGKRETSNPPGSKSPKLTLRATGPANQGPCDPLPLDSWCWFHLGGICRHEKWNDLHLVSLKGIPLALHSLLVAPATKTHSGALAALGGAM